MRHSAALKKKNLCKLLQMEGRANIQIGGCFANTLKINVLLLAAAYYSKMSFFPEKEAAAACLGECRGGSPGQPLATSFFAHS